VKGELNDGRLNVSAAVFSIRKTGNAVVDASDPGSCPGSLASSDCYRNGGKLRSKGFELEASGELAPGWQMMAGYTHVTSRDDEGATISAETPRHLLRLSTSYQLPGKWNAFSVGGGVSAQSSYSYPAYDDPDWRMGRRDARCGTCVPATGSIRAGAWASTWPTCSTRAITR
jgi:iron complex outermembrane receptor protein/outer membrane receptor for ferric coprogen and ferric-rhodotorulic acid